MRALELRIPPLAVVLIFAVAMTAVANLAPVPMPMTWRAPISGVFVLAGLSVALAGVLAFRRHKTTVNPFTPDRSSSLVASGIYRISRNPMYLGFLLALLGWASFLGSWASAAFLPAFIVYMNRFQIQPEERALADRFGQEFTTYAGSVRRWL